MASVVIEDITNLSLSSNGKNLCNTKDVVESLFTLYVVCYIFIRRERRG